MVIVAFIIHLLWVTSQTDHVFVAFLKGMKLNYKVIYKRLIIVKKLNYTEDSSHELKMEFFYCHRQTFTLLLLFLKCMCKIKCHAKFIKNFLIVCFCKRGIFKENISDKVKENTYSSNNTIIFTSINLYTFSLEA